MISFTIPGAPRGKQRARAAVIKGHARVYTPKETRSEEGAVRLFASQAMAGRPPMEGPVSLTIAAHFPIPMSWSNVKQRKAIIGIIRPTGRPDWDNCGKLICDALNGIAYRDDSQIVSVLIEKHYSVEPRVAVTIDLLQTTQELAA